MAARLQAVETLLDEREVRHEEFEVQALQIAPGVDRTLQMRNGRVFEGTNDVQEGVGLAQSGQLIGRQLFGADSAVGRGGRCRQVEVRHVGVDDLLGLEDLRQSVESLVRNLHGPNVQFHPAVAAGLGVAPSKSVKDRRLPRAG